MATVDDESPAETVADEANDAGTWGEVGVGFGVDRLVASVVVVAAVALLVRFVALGERTAHWDEARVAWWTLDYMRTGVFEFRAITHGPFYHHVNAVVFEVFGPSDASMRYVPALVGGLLPLTALGLRHRLRDSEVLALALFLAANPVLLYYSRFMRGDPLVGGAMFGAFVMFVRVVDFRSKPALFAGVGLVALGFTIKANAVLYLLCWGGASLLLLDQRLFRARDRTRDWTAVLVDYVVRTARGVWTWLPWLALAFVEFLVVVVYFYAPRAGDGGGVGLGHVASDPSMLSAVLYEATVGTYDEVHRVWLSGDMQDHPYLPYLSHYVETLAWGALILCAFAIVGFVVDRYGGDDPRDVVAFAAYWGFASVLGYPISTDIQAPWATIHAILPLAIPAAVGIGLVVRWGRDARADRDTVGLALTALVGLVVVGYVAGAGLWMVYLTPQDDGNQLVQYAQPGDNLQPALDRMEAVSEPDGEVDVVLHSEEFVDGEAQDDGQTPACADWFSSLPLPWYFSTYETDVDCAEDDEDLAALADEEPPIVITHQAEASAVREQFPEYWTATYKLRTTDTEATVFFRPDVATEPDAGPT